MGRAVLVVAGSIVLTAVACAAPKELPTPPQAPRRVVELDQWQVLHGETTIGFVVRLEIQDPQGPLRFYRVEDRSRRWVGHATEQGRFSRRVPFQDDEQDLGVWPFSQGVAQLLEAGGTVDLRPVAKEADLRRADR